MKTHTKTLGGLTLLIAFWVVAVCYAQEKERAAQVLPSIKKLMSHEEFTERVPKTGPGGMLVRSVG